MTTYINNHWYFIPSYNKKIHTLSKEEVCSSFEEVRLPHIQSEICHEACYVYFFPMEDQWEKKHVTMTFYGIQGQTEVFCNNHSLAIHDCDYTAFTVDLSQSLQNGENCILVKIKGSHACINRDVEMKVTENSYLKDVFVKADMNKIVTVEYTGIHTEECQIAAEVADEYGTYVASFPVEDYRDHISLQMLDALLWDQSHPHLYTLHLYLLKEGHTCDVHKIRFGFRTIEVRKNGVYLNSKKVRIRGLNRHQNYPFLNQSPSWRAERFDADILKRELGCNSVCTSQYPQSQDFLNRCDEIGLLVLSVIPQVNQKQNNWQKQVIQNTEEMILQMRNHPSIYMWSVRMTNSADNDTLYTKTNHIAHQLDPTRPTTGIRNSLRSSLQEDVYAYEDHQYEATDKGCESKSNVTSDEDKPYLIAGYEQTIQTTHSLDQALRHAYVLNEIRGKKDIIGSYGCYMVDKKDSQGVMDVYRNPRLVSYFYASQGKKKPILKVEGSYIFTNCDFIEIYKNGRFIKKYTPSSEYSHLLHAPIYVDDPIGALLGNDKQEEKLKAVLLAIDHYGIDHLPLSIKIKMKFLHHTQEELLSLCNDYLHNETDIWEYKGFKKGKVVITEKREPVEKVSLQVKTNTRKLVEGRSWDMASIRIAYVDQNDHVLSDMNKPLHLDISGPGEIIGPHDLIVEEGMTGTYIRTVGQTGKVALKISSPETKSVTLHFFINSQENHIH